MRSLCLRIVTSHTKSPRHDQSILSSVHLFVFSSFFLFAEPRIRDFILLSGPATSTGSRLLVLGTAVQSLAILLEILGEEETPTAEITSAQGPQDIIYLAKYGMRVIYYITEITTEVLWSISILHDPPDCMASATKKRQIMKSAFGGPSIR